MPETTTRLTKVRVLKDVPCDDTYTDVRYFEDTGSQQAFFEGFVKHTYENAAYQRVNDQVAPYRELLTLRIPAVADDVYDCNYIMFQNQPYGQKWFYAFIRKVNFVSPNCTKIDYEIDWFQTYMCDFEIHPCMVLREHLSAAEDQPFANCVPEPIMVPRYTVDTSSTARYMQGGTTPVNTWVTLAIIPNTLTVALIEASGFPLINKGGLYNGIYNGAWYLSCPALAAPALFEALITALAAVDCAEQICDVFMTPSPPIPNTNNANQSSYNTGISTTKESFTTVDGSYTIHNKKLLSYPFTFIEGTSDSGEAVNYKPELIGEGTLQGNVYTLSSNEFGIKFIPDYMGLNAGDGQNVPTLSYSCSIHCTWIGQAYGNAFIANAVRIGFNAIKSGADLITQSASGGIGGSNLAIPGQSVPGSRSNDTSGSTGSLLGDTLSNIYNTIFDSPEQHYNNAGADALNFSIGMRGFAFARKCATVEWMQKIDQYFDMYGYQVNTCKMPNLKTRAKWNYVQLQKPCITGSVPVQGMDAIKAAFARGVRLWHVDEIGQYNGPGDNPAQ